MSERELYCDSCQGVQQFETPPCDDGHGADCPELVCTRCGGAVLIATFTFGAPRLGRARRQPAAPRRRAA
ncbi:hypothetical protein E1211_14075 [Micromonospora sp. 15K316]|uniref:hypothetical protein n=1 Tax=Micromonospora sp. 15K316 TaxID=2530376 RepID=UPI00104D96DA|nr:hypothetical protein [Micromonospora sp. 15K316]TDC36232.1 hypothetical protein E1211_14075 [Micromonospora sp. 15K316]